MKTICLRDIKKRIETQKDKYQELRKQRGMTLLEIIIVLAIVGSIAAGVVVLAQRAYDSQAIADLVNKTNVVRTAMKGSYGPTGTYPVWAAVPATDAAITADATAASSAIHKLFQMGKISLSEAKNNISGDFFNVVGAEVSGTANKGYAVVVNGLDQRQCRSLLGQVANNWDYVGIVDAGAGVNADPAVDMSAALAAGPGAGAILRSVIDTGNVNVTPDQVVTLCVDAATNGVVLGSR